VDKHNICFVCDASVPTHTKMETTAVMFLFIGLVLFQISILGFFFVKQEYPQACVVLAVAVLSIVVYSFFVWRRKAFHKKRIDRLDRVFDNTRNKMKQEEDDIEEASMTSFAEGGEASMLVYVHPLFKENDPSRKSLQFAKAQHVEDDDDE
jgi:hypothetical protein